MNNLLLHKFAVSLLVFHEETDLVFDFLVDKNQRDLRNLGTF